MRYFGGKTKTCNQISEIIQHNLKEGQLFISPFVGGGWVECLVEGEKQCCDKHPYLIAMYQELQKGWKPPTALTKEEYQHIKDNLDEKPYLSGFVGFGCSFAGKWFGGYAHDKTARNYYMNAYTSILRKMEGFKDTVFECKSYSEINPVGAVIYCDPPYKGTTPYSRNIIGAFDSEAFWEKIREWSENNVVLVSEYNAPDDFKCVWQQQVKLDIRDKENKKKTRVEKLFSLSDVKLSSPDAGIFDVI